MTRIIRKEDFLAFSFERASYAQQGFVAAINTPAIFVAAVVSYAAVMKPRWTPHPLMPWQWLVVSYPIYMLPAWIFLGWSLEALFGTKRMPGWAGWTSFTVACGFACLAVAFRFGFSAAEREGQDLLGSYIVGLLLWAALLILPFAAAIRCKRRRIATPVPTS